MGSRKITNRIKTIGIYACSCIVFILTMEISARVDDKLTYGAPLLSEYGPERLRESDLQGVWHNIANASFEKWVINKDGFRGPSVSRKKTWQVRRIVCMGTSETFGLYETDDKEWPRQLNRILNKTDHYEIINAAVVGLSLRNWKRYLVEYVLDFEPDQIILYVNPFNYIRKPRLESTTTQKSTLVASDLVKAGGGGVPGIDLKPRLMKKIKPTIKNLVPSIVLERFQIWSTNRQIAAIEESKLNGTPPIDEISEEQTAYFQSDLEDLVSFLQQKGITVVLSSYPVLISKDNLDRHLALFLDNRRFMIELSLLGMIDASVKFDKVIKHVAQKYQTGFVDMNQMLGKDPLYFSDNVHYSDFGAEKVAMGFANLVLESSQN